ncbi:hypothetical protein N7533_009710 [Penicillium manginii]|uniref:uncharacterized protein n=1 Tax=Penicillium manginii TaxID=203109 RepID=UPI002546C691|nr:uncharacterized protein N7533_009710 [Penicillium manginii]KAJ5744840.1 hypothetical protein N7533_009710 [Penicillium manginii]
MVLGIVMMAAMLPTMIGLNEATQGSREQEEARRNESRKQRGHLVATVAITQGTPKIRQQVHNAQVQVGLDGRLYITKHPSASMVPFNGSYFTHPDFPPNNTSGLVTVSGEKNAHSAVDEQYLTMEGWEGWLAVRLPKDEAQVLVNGASANGDSADINDGETWRLYFDGNDDGAGLPQGSKGLEIRLKRTMATS